MNELSRIAIALSDAVDSLRFGPPVTHVYNPLVYARAPHLEYLERYGAKSPRPVVMVGMNPGPWGMAQTGVPFGEISFVRDWLGIDGVVEKPPVENPRRPIEGFDCARSEVSGSRLWGWAKDRFGTPDAFFDQFFVWNYCPLVFMEESGRNYTPNRLTAAERAPLFDACDHALAEVVRYLRPDCVVGIGTFAEDRTRAALGDEATCEVGRILHPSPASPKANQGWSEQIEAELETLGVLFGSLDHERATR